MYSSIDFLCLYFFNGKMDTLVIDSKPMVILSFVHILIKSNYRNFSRYFVTPMQRKRLKKLDTERKEL